MQFVSSDTTSWQMMHSILCYSDLFSDYNYALLQQLNTVSVSSVSNVLKMYNELENVDIVTKIFKNNL